MEEEGTTEHIIVIPSTNTSEKIGSMVTTNNLCENDNYAFSILLPLET